MAQVVLDLGRAKELAELAVQEKGREYRYRNVDLDNDDIRDCVYFENDGSPSCLVGHILHYAGVSAQHYLDGDLNEVGVGELIDSYEALKCDTNTQMFLTTLQNRQDAGEPWGKTLDVATKLASYEMDNAGVVPQQEEQDADHVPAGA